MPRFFVSYNKADQAWAEWIAWILEAEGHTAVIQAWDFRPGGNFVLDMQQATVDTDKTLVVLSEDYLKAEYTQPEWATAFADDPRSVQRKIIPIKVRACNPSGLLRPIVYVDVVGLEREAAQQKILAALPERLKPDSEPPFPRTSQTEPDRLSFPDSISMNNSPQSERSIHIGGNVTGSTIISGDGNSVNSQASQPSYPGDTPLRRKLLILAANPKSLTRLRLDEEVRDISEGLKRARHRDDFEIVQRWAVRPRDFQRAMLEETPQMVHFSGHGEGEAGLYFEDEVGNPKRVTGSALASLFKLFAQKAQIECVVLNGCYSQAQAVAIAEHVPYVVGMQQAVGDQAAIEFAVGFYDALGNGESVDFAFESGKVAMALNSTGYAEIPVLLTGH